MKSNITALEFKIHEMAARIAALREIEGFTTAEMAAESSGALIGQSFIRLILKKEGM